MKLYLTHLGYDFFSFKIKQLFETIVLNVCFLLITSDNIIVKPRQMKKLSSYAIKILQVLHFVFSFMWLGGAMALTIISFSIIPLTSQEVFIYSHLLDFIDRWMIIFGAYGILITGLVYSVCTNWGFTKYYWVTAKWVIVILQVLFGTFVLGPWVTENVKISESMNARSLPNQEFFSNLHKIAVWGSIQTIFLLLLLILSVWKPWGKRNCFHKIQAQQSI